MPDPQKPSTNTIVAFRRSRLSHAVRRWLPGLGWLLIALAYGVLVLIVLPQTAFFCGDEGIKTIQVQNLVDRGWAGTSIEYPGRVLDPTWQFFPIPSPFSFIHNGSVYAIYPLAFALLASLPYALVGYAGLYLIPVSAGLISLFLTYRLARMHLDRVRATLAMLLLALATPFSFYCLLFWEHTLAVALFLFALAFLISPSSASRRWQFVLGGLCLGVMVSFRTEGYVLSLTVIASWAVVYRRWINASLIALGTVLGLIPLWISNQALYGTLSGPHIRATLSETNSIQDLLASRLQIAAGTIIQGSVSQYVDAIFALVLFAVCAILVTRLRRSKVVVGTSVAAILLLGAVNVIGAERIVIRGLLPSCPLVALVIVYVWVRSKQERSAKRMLEDFFVLIFLGSLVLVTFMTPMDTGLHWGPRLLLPVLPLVVILIVGFLAVSPDAPQQAGFHHFRTVQLVGMALILFSVIVQIQGIRLLAQKKTESARLVTYFRDLQTRYVLSEVNWFAAESASLFYQQTFFYVADQASYEELVDRLYAQGTSDFAMLPLATSNITMQFRTHDYRVEQIRQFHLRIVLENSLGITRDQAIPRER